MRLDCARPQDIRHADIRAERSFQQARVCQIPTRTVSERALLKFGMG
jgi:hypothetical protein